MSALWFIGFSLIWTALLTGGAYLLSREPVPARFAHKVWRGAAMLSLLPWLLVIANAILPARLATPIPDMPYIGSAVEALSQSAALTERSETGSGLALGGLLWAVVLAGWGVRAVLNLLSQIRLQAIKRSAKAAIGANSLVWAAQLNLRKAPHVALIEGGSPFLAGIRKRTIYLPKAIARSEEANIILAHECTHIARGDLITRPMERFIADLFWFSPFAWIMRQQLDYWREAACDAQTTQLTGDSVGYARVLAKTARLARPIIRRNLPVAAFILPRKATLKRRLTQLLEESPQRPRRTLALFTCLAGLMLAPLSLAQTTSLPGNSPFSHALITDANAHIMAAFGKTNYYGEMTWHSGVDIKAPQDSCVHAPTDAIVISTSFKTAYGKTLDIKLSDGRKMRFANLAQIKVEEGDKIEAGEIIGTVGMTAKGVRWPHLHVEVYDHGEYVDPQGISGLTLHMAH